MSDRRSVVFLFLLSCFKKGVPPPPPDPKVSGHRKGIWTSQRRLLARRSDATLETPGGNNNNNNNNIAFKSRRREKGSRAFPASSSTREPKGLWVGLRPARSSVPQLVRRVELFPLLASQSGEDA